MIEYIHPNGYSYTADEVAVAARKNGMTSEEYIIARGLKQKVQKDTLQKKQPPKKQTPAVPQETTTAEEPKSMASKSATTSSVSKKNLFDSKPTPSFGEEVTGQKFDFKTAGQSKQYKAQQKVLKEAEAKQTELAQAKMEAKTAKIKAEKTKVNNEYLAYTKPTEEYMVGLDADIKTQLDNDGKEETYVDYGRSEFAQPEIRKPKINSFAVQKQQVITDLAAKGQLKNYNNKQILALAAEKYKKEQITKHVSAKTAEFYDQFSVSKEDQELMSDYKAKDFNFKNLDLQRKAELNNKLSTHLMDTGEQLSELATKLEAYGKDYKFKDQTEVDEYNAMLSQYKVLSEDFKNVNTAFNINSSDFAASKEKLKSAEEEFDLAKRNYGWENYAKRAIIPFAQMGGSAAQIINLANTLNPFAWAADYIAQNLGIKGASFEDRANYIAKSTRVNDEILTNELRKTPEVNDLTSFLEASYDVISTQIPNFVLMFATGGLAAATRAMTGATAAEATGLTARALAKKEITDIGTKAFQTVAGNNQFLKFGEAVVKGLSLGPELQAIATISGGQKYNEMQAEKLFDGAKYTPIQMVAASTLFGYSEGLGEKVTLDIFKGGARTIKSAFEKGVEKEFIDRLKEKTVADWFGNAGKFIIEKGKDFSNENISEQFTNVVQNSTDKFLLNKNVNILDNTGEVFKDTSLLSAWMIGAPHVAGVAIRPFIGRDSSTELKDNSAEIAKYASMLQNPNITDAEKSAYETKIKDLTDKSSTIFKKVIKNIEGMPTSTFHGILKSTNELGAILQKAKEVYNSDSVDKDSALKILEEEYKAKEKALDQSINETKIISEIGNNYIIEDKQKIFRLSNRVSALRKEIDQIKNDPNSAALLADKKMMLSKINSQLDEIIENGPDRLKFAREFAKDIENTIKANKALGLYSSVAIAPVFEDTKGLEQYLTDNTTFSPEEINYRIENNYGIFIPSDKMKVKEGTAAVETLVINQPLSKLHGVVTTGMHETLHALLYKAVKGNVEFQKNLGDSLYEYLEQEFGKEYLEETEFYDRYAGEKGYINKYYEETADLEAMLESGKEKLAAGKITKEAFDSVQSLYDSQIALYQGNLMEEILTLLSESLKSGDIKYKESLFVKIGDLLRNILQKIGVNVRFDNGRDVFNFVRDYNKSFEKGKFTKAFKKLAQKGEYAGAKKGSSTEVGIAKGSLSIQERMDKLDDQLDAGEIDYDDYETRMDALILEEEKALKAEKEKKIIEKKTVEAKPAETKTAEPKQKVKKEVNLEDEVKEIIANNKATIASDKVQQIYDKEGVNGAQKIIDLFKPITAKIVDKRRDAPGFDRELLTDEIETGVSGILDMITKYDPKSKVPLAAYINKYLPVRAIAASKRVLDKSFSKDIEDQKGLMATETAEQTVTTQMPERPKYTNILEAGMFEDEVINSIVSKALTVLRTLKTKINEPISKNVTATPLIREIREEMGTQADIDIKRALGGKEGGVLKRNLLKNKKVILENMTTTWLMGKDTKNGIMGGVPPAIQKQVNGKWLSYPDWVGKTPDREKTTTDLAGRTSGADMVRRLPNADNNVSNEEFLSWFLEPSGNPIRGRKESLSKALAEELSFDIISKDFATGGPLFEAFSANQERLGAEMEKVIPVEFNRQVERGNVKASMVRVNNAALRVLKQNSWDIKSEAYVNFFKQQNKEARKHLRETLNRKRVSGLIRMYNAIRDEIAWVKYEIQMINNLNEYLKKSDDYEGIKVISKGNAGSNSRKVDLEIKIGNTIINIELKLNKKAQIGSFTVKNMYSIITGKSEANKISGLPLNNEINNQIFKKIIENSEKIQEYIDYLLANGGVLLPSGTIHVDKTVFIDAQELGLQENATTVLDGNDGFTENLINLMNVKGNDAIGFKDSGLYGLDDSKFGNLLPPLVGKVNLTIRAMRNSIKNKPDKIAVTFRAFPTMDSSWDQTSPIEISDDPKPLLDTLAKTDLFNGITRQNNIAKASLASLSPNYGKNPKKIRVFDFDDTLAQTKSNVLYTLPEDETQYKIDAATFAKEGAQLLADGAEFDFSEFSKVMNGKKGPLFEVAKIIAGKRGTDDVFVLTARPENAAVPIHEFLKELGLNIPVKNIIGLGNSSPQAKADWIVSKVGEGYNDFYFADDHTGNVKAVKDALSVFDVKSRVQQAKIKVNESVEDFKNTGFLNDKQVAELQKEIEANYNTELKLGNKNNDIRTSLFNYDSPIAQKISNGVDLRITEGLIKDKKKTYLLYADGKIVGQFNAVDDAKNLIKYIEDNLIKPAEIQSKVKESLAVGKRFNNIIAKNKNVSPAIKYSGITAKRLGAKKGKYKFFLPPGAEDFEGLLYNFIGKGKTGEEQAKFFEDALINPYWDGVAAIESARQRIKKDFIALKEAFPGAAKKITKRTPDGNFTYDQAVRVYLWTKEGVKIPDLSKTDQRQLNRIVQNDSELFAFANGLELISGRDGKWSEPGEFWDSETIVSELNNMTEKIGRKKYLEQFIENADEIFTDTNLNKIEALYGAGFRDALEDSLYRMKNGKNRSQGAGKFTTAVSTWVNGSVAEIMFLNTKSGILQLISALNYLNLNDNNPIMAGKALLNFPQFAKDFAMIFNSDMMKERRQGLKEDVSAAEIANAAATAKNKVRALVAYLAKIGFTPTTIADALSIGMGGATFYRNRVNSYVKKGLDVKEAEAKAWKDFTRLTNKSAQSNDPALISQQQAEPIGRLILAFGNATMQMNRIMKKSAKDLINGRGNPAEHISRILFYGFIQNALFSALQKALFIGLFGTPDDDEDKKKVKTTEEKALGLADDMLDSFLRGSGLAGAVVSTVKNTAQQYVRQRDKGAKGDQAYTLLEGLNISPSIGSKARKVYSAIQEEKYNRKVIKRMGGDIILEGRLNPSPIYAAGAKLTAAATNLPADRVLDKITNITEALDARNENWQRAMLMLGYKPFELGVKNEEQEFLKKLGTDDFSDEELNNMSIEKIRQVEDAEYEAEIEADLKAEQKELEDEEAEIEEERSERKKLYE